MNSIVKLIVKFSSWETGVVLIHVPRANGGEPVLRVFVVTWLGNDLNMFADSRSGL
jgi:hypothetical protein